MNSSHFRIIIVLLEIANLVLSIDLSYLPYFMDTIIDALENEDDYIKSQGT